MSTSQDMTTFRARLEHIRQMTGLDLEAFFEMLCREKPGDPLFGGLGSVPEWEEQCSYGAAVTYHYGRKPKRVRGKQPPRHYPDPPVSYLNRILEVFPQINPRWLFANKGLVTLPVGADTVDPSLDDAAASMAAKRSPRQNDEYDVWSVLAVAKVPEWAQHNLHRFYYDWVESGNRAPAAVGETLRALFPETMRMAGRPHTTADLAVHFNEVAMRYLTEFGATKS